MIDIKILKFKENKMKNSINLSDKNINNGL